MRSACDGLFAREREVFWTGFVFGSGCGERI
jgi:hypothetical protein